MSSSEIEFSNPILKDRIKILESTPHKLVFRTFLAPNGGQHQLHYHSKLNETFKIIKGELNVIINQTEKKLTVGDQYTIENHTNHRFLNRSEVPVIFEVDILNPKKMINALQIMYGLVNDGKTASNGLPKNIFYTAIALHMMDAFSPKIPYLIQKTGISYLALLGKVLGIEKLLIAKYCK